MFNPLTSLRDTVSSAIAKRRALTSKMKDMGAGFVEYGAVILLVAAIAAVVVTQTGIPQTINGMIESAVASVGEAGDEGEGEDEGDDDDD